MFLWVWQIMTITHVKRFEDYMKNHSNVCYQSCMYTYRESKINHPSLIHPAVDELHARTVTIIVGHGGFCSRYSNDWYAVGIYMGIACDGKLSDSSPVRSESLYFSVCNTS